MVKRAANVQICRYVCAAPCYSGNIFLHFKSFQVVKALNWKMTIIMILTCSTLTKDTKHVMTHKKYIFLSHNNMRAQCKENTITQKHKAV